MRDCQNKLFYYLYCVLRFFTVTFWTYFLPTFGILIQFAIPWYTNTGFRKVATEDMEQHKFTDDGGISPDKAAF